VIFDYFSETDFKFAGVNISVDKLQIGYRDANGWHVIDQDNAQLKPNKDYEVLVAINGTTVTVDENYLRSSIVDPQAQIVAGFDPVMPTYQGRLKDKEITAIIELWCIEYWSSGNTRFVLQRCVLFV